MSLVSSVGTASYPPPASGTHGTESGPRDKPHDGDGDDGKSTVKTAASSTAKVNVLA
jgi:hypothetical protein